MVIFGLVKCVAFVQTRSIDTVIHKHIVTPTICSVALYNLPENEIRLNLSVTKMTHSAFTQINVTHYLKGFKTCQNHCDNRKGPLY